MTTNNLVSIVQRLLQNIYFFLQDFDHCFSTSKLYVGVSHQFIIGMNQKFHFLTC